LVARTAKLTKLAGAAICGLGFLTALTSAAFAVEGHRSDLVNRQVLRVCADPANMPFSNEKEEGFENKIAHIIADELKIPVKYTWFPQATGFTRNTLLYMRDVYDHTIHIIESVESLRDLTAGMLDIYMSSVSYRISIVMKVLTVITTIFMPLGLIASFYGMNFKYLPGLEWHWSIFVVLGAMLAISIGMLALFRWKKWL